MELWVLGTVCVDYVSSEVEEGDDGRFADLDGNAAVRGVGVEER